MANKNFIRSAAQEPMLQDVFNEILKWRCIGPYRGGRVVAVAGDPSEQAVFYFGACAGGVWKTYDGGTYWENVSDGFFNTASVGAIAVSNSDPQVVFVGTGEACIRGDVSHGDGVYRSRDGGKTWTHLGLEDTRHISRIRIHPQNPDLVYVAALGHAFGLNAERGVFRSHNGGDSWEQVFCKGEGVGIADLCMDTNDPLLLYASPYEVRRTFWDITSGGINSGIYKSENGGDTWVDVSNNPGMCNGIKGRIGLAISPAKAGRVWALVEARNGGLFRSDDFGVSWKLINDQPELRARPYYYSHIYADPLDSEGIWVMSSMAWKSADGGRSFKQVSTPHADNHDLWIDSQNNKRMIQGNDGGACVTYNGGESWSTVYNQPTAEFYRIATDSQFPYRVYGTQQDNTAISVPSRSNKGAILWTDCYTCGSSESGDIAVNPRDSNIVYSGAIGSSPGGGDSLIKYDHRTGDSRIISVWPEMSWAIPPRDFRYRFAWTYPIVPSFHQQDTIYIAGNLVFKSTDDGDSWCAISPDLTRDDSTKQDVSGGAISLEGGASDVYCTIFSLAESPHEPGVLWAGSDDGLVHISRDDGRTWQNVTPQDMPDWIMVHKIEISPHNRATAYLAGTRYKFDDNKPYLYKTNDYGKTWSKIIKGIPHDHFTRTIREDPDRRGLLYAGTELGLYVSLNDGEFWQPLQCNMPIVPIYDIEVKEKDLVLATHGRSFWILDDLSPLHQYSDEVTRLDFHLFKPRSCHRVSSNPNGFLPDGKTYMLGSGVPATSMLINKPNGEMVRTLLDAGQNPPIGIVVNYHMNKKSEVLIRFLDSEGCEIKKFSSSDEGSGKVDNEVGGNRFVWDMRYPNARNLSEGNKSVDKGKFVLDVSGPLVTPGTYWVEMKAHGKSYKESFKILKDPRTVATQEELEEQLRLLTEIRDKLSEIHQVTDHIRSLMVQMEDYVELKDSPEIIELAKKIKNELGSVEYELVPVLTPGLSLRFLPTRLNAKVAALTSVVSSVDAKPTQGAYDVFNDLSKRVEFQIEKYQKIINIQLPKLVSLADVEKP